MKKATKLVVARVDAILRNDPILGPRSARTGKTKSSAKSGRKNPFTWYSDKLIKWPLITKMVTSGTLCGAGDLLCQTINGDGSSFNLKRAAAFTAMGVIYVAPALHLNFVYILPRVVPASKNASKVIQGLKKVAFDQSCIAPIFTVGLFMTINLLEGHGFSGGLLALKTKLWETMLVGWRVWIPVNFINFSFIPVMYQLLFVNVVAVFYNGFLSYMQHDR